MKNTVAFSVKWQDFGLHYPGCARGKYQQARVLASMEIIQDQLHNVDYARGLQEYLDRLDGYSWN